MTDGEQLLHDDVSIISIDDILPYSNNPKQHPDAQIEKIASSIKNYGWDQPIVVDGDNEIIKGHGRHQAAKRLGLDEVPVIVRDDLNSGEAKASRIADNKTSESGWNDELLLTELESLEPQGIEAEDLGFDEDEYDDLTEDFGSDEDLVMDDFDTPSGDVDTSLGLDFDSEADYDDVVEWFNSAMEEWGCDDREQVLVELSFVPPQEVDP